MVAGAVQLRTGTVAVPATGEFMDKFCGKEEESTAVIELVKT